MNSPLITVIIPARNSADSIGGAIKSIQYQTYKNLEIIIVDDNSTDDTYDVIKNIIATDTRIKYIKMDVDDPNRFDVKINRNINAGYAARNFGFNYATGELITFQDADDVSLLNRIEVQYNFLVKYNATHLSLSWTPYQDDFVGKKLNVDKYLKENIIRIYKPDELYFLARKTKGLLTTMLGRYHSMIPFHFKRKRVIHRLFFGSYESYPEAGNTPLFRREVLERVKFRKLAERVWPTHMGRGADRDFNFNTALTFRNSYVVSIPLYLWDNRSSIKNSSISKYIED